MPPFLIPIAVRLLAAVLFALACAGAGAFVAHRMAAGQIAQVTVERDQLSHALAAVAEQRQKDLALLARRTKENAAAARQMAELRQRLDIALQVNREWAETVVPKEVQDALAQP